MNDAEKLRARGWSELTPGFWRTDRRPAMGPTRTYDAVSLCEARDIDDAKTQGSVTYRPTAEQAQSPLCAALAARNANEREVIAALHQEAKELRELLMRALETQEPSPIVIASKAASEPPKGAVVCRKCSQWTSYGTSHIGPCRESTWTGVGRRDPKHEWAKQ